MVVVFLTVAVGWIEGCEGAHLSFRFAEVLFVFVDPAVGLRLAIVQIVLARTVHKRSFVHLDHILSI
jgi:hypothetical protein